MNTHEQTIRRFYEAFAQLDADTMAACYAPDAVFEDEIFKLEGARAIGGMWKMLCTGTRAKGAHVWKLAYSGVHVEGARGQAHWDAHYLFSATGRIVDNAIDARFTFTPEGLIATHRDRFAFWTWARQALGVPGLLLGWSPSLRRKVRGTAAANLQAFLARNP